MLFGFLAILTLAALVGLVVGIQGDVNPDYLPPDWEEFLKEGLDDPWEEDDTESGK